MGFITLHWENETVNFKITCGLLSVCHILQYSMARQSLGLKKVVSHLIDVTIKIRGGLTKR